jgi:hypothetical protein
MALLFFTPNMLAAHQFERGTFKRYVILVLFCLICAILILTYHSKASKEIISPLPLSAEGFRQSVEQVTFDWQYTRDIKPHKFDCSDTSQITWYKLSDAGFKPKLMVGKLGGINHMWVAVPSSDNTWALVETAFTDLKIMGITVDDQEYRVGTMYDNPWEATTATKDPLLQNSKLMIIRREKP